MLFIRSSNLERHSSTNATFNSRDTLEFLYNFYEYFICVTIKVDTYNSTHVRKCHQRKG